MHTNDTPSTRTTQNELTMRHDTQNGNDAFRMHASHTNRTQDTQNRCQALKKGEKHPDCTQISIVTHLAPTPKERRGLDISDTPNLYAVCPQTTQNGFTHSEYPPFPPSSRTHATPVRHIRSVRITQNGRKKACKKQSHSIPNTYDTRANQCSVHANHSKRVYNVRKHTENAQQAWKAWKASLLKACLHSASA
jgi:hypothetical protein